MKIVILCAGRGSRLGEMTDFVPKAMITINRKPIIGHILDHIYTGSSFDIEPEVAIAVGYKHKVLESYINDFYPGNSISFVNVDNFQEKGSGPGYSLLQMKDFVADEPFILILGDTLCFDDLANLAANSNIICTYPVDDSSRFTTCEIDEDGLIHKFYDKVKNAPSNMAIIGVYFIKDSSLFFEGLEKTRDLLIKGEFYRSATAWLILLKKSVKLSL